MNAREHAPLLTGIHHVTAMAGAPSINRAFYCDTLGLRLVKKTVNFDDPSTYHLYFADHLGTPGTVMTFFPHPDIRVGVAGAGEVSTTNFSIPVGAMGFWIDRLRAAGAATNEAITDGRPRAEFSDPHGTRLAVVESADALPTTPADTIDPRYAINGFDGVTITLGSIEPTARLLIDVLQFRPVDGFTPGQRFVLGEGAGHQRLDVRVDPTLPRRPRLGAGSVHHVAWRVPDDAKHEQIRRRLLAANVPATQVLDRNYFHSIYFREPGGVLFEIATDSPGFAVDESLAELGRGLKLPSGLENQRGAIESILPAI